MIGQLIELSSFGRKLKCCQHLKGHVGLVVDVTSKCELLTDPATQYWIEWIGIPDDEAYPLQAGKVGIALANGTWNRRDFKLVKKNK